MYATKWLFCVVFELRSRIWIWTLASELSNSYEKQIVYEPTSLKNVVFVWKRIWIVINVLNELVIYVHKSERV